MFPQDTDSEEVGIRLRNAGSNGRSRMIEAWPICTNRCLCDLVFTLPFWDVFCFVVSAGQSLNPGICRQSDHDLRIVEVIWVDVKSPLRISKCPRRIPNSNSIEFPSLHFLTCACFYRRSLHHLKRCRTPNRRGTNKKESDLLSVQILEASWPNESWQEQVLPLDLPPRPPILPETPEEAWFHVKWAGPGLPRTPHHCQSSPFDLKFLQFFMNPYFQGKNKGEIWVSLVQRAS